MAYEPFRHQVTLQAMLDEARLEVLTRKRVYSDRIYTSRMSPTDANRKIAAMEAICDAIEHLMRAEGIKPLPAPRERQPRWVF